MSQITSKLCSRGSGGSLVFWSMRPELGGRGWKLAVTTGQTDVRPMKSRVCKDRGKGKTSPEVGRSLTEKNINQNIVLMQYAVRGPLVIRTGVIESELQKVPTRLLFCLGIVFPRRNNTT